ncbi:conserved hypothetical protein [Bosea sp. 62]|uniref:hypothetical protein n=1 Tax=unclassified Bosea (in: a-proteobacteria) TaxID=2653178 RepID=UPI00125BEF4C|nr:MULTISPECIES: hypothetical protein [unclassified Bosea (in: a-proteobacteria)]CAD5257152.1 conserved hypothetical protein [Bosea sp. 7B]CAD5273118.1 conserved hypothetical protein [Bosea sp. 21B]CAD5284982.1 conserved hypothetical protein [Bosea sp. 46]VVT60241.1 conserved hypothetical protein [Bosea sp. EC-HK365B]VXB60590.1 conserved hypothetical protein [Bosea sp. 62]
MTSNLTRRQLYDLIWSHEMPQVAEHLGISEWQIRQICEDHRVPLPKAAFWRDKAAGRRTKQAIFTTTMDATLEVITFNGSKPIAPLPTVSPAPVRPPAAPKRELPKKARAKGVEWVKVAQPHHALLAVAKELRAKKPDAHGVVITSGDTTPHTSVGFPSVERAIFVLDRIFRDLETRGIGIKLSRQWFTVTRGDESVDFKLSEKVAKVKHVPTDYELQQEARRLRSGGENYSWYWNKAYPEFDYLLTGALKLSMSLWGSHGSRLDWQDRKTFSLEDQIDDIVIAFEERLEADRLRKIGRERERRLSIRADENRRLAEQRRKREDERDALIAEIVQLQAKARDLRAWIDWAAPIEDFETKRMLEWARSRLASIERAVNPARFGDWLREKKLFPEVDPFAPLPADPDLEEA